MRDASLGYGERLVLSDVNLEIAPGDFATVIGPSGSGKSTLLRAAAGLLEPLAGTIERNDKQVAWVPQSESLGLLHPVSALEVARAGASRRGKQATRDAEAALDCLGLGGLGRRRFANLSGGQRQRVLVARALVQEANIIIFDEPTSALDDASKERVLDAARERSRSGTTILYATHQPEELKGLATRTISVNLGTLMEQGEPATWT